MVKGEEFTLDERQCWGNPSKAQAFEPFGSDARRCAQRTCGLARYFGIDFSWMSECIPLRGVRKALLPEVAVERSNQGIDSGSTRLAEVVSGPVPWAQWAPPALIASTHHAIVKQHDPRSGMERQVGKQRNARR